MPENLLRALGVVRNEDVISNLLAHALERSPSFRQGFLALSGCDPEVRGHLEYEVQTRTQIPEAGVPDLVIACTRKEGGDLVIVENKLGAKEGKDQTTKYAEDATVEHLARRFKLGTAEPFFVYLPLFPDDEPRSTRFKTVPHSALLGIERRRGEDAVADQLLDAWLETLADFYSAAELDDEVLVLDALSSEGTGTERGYLAFVSLMRQLRLPPGVRINHTFRENKSGRHYYGARFSKPAWESDPFSRSRDQWELPPENRSIHIEPQFSALDGALSVAVHYETNPYATGSKLKQRIAADQLQVYGVRRDRFYAHLAAVGLPGDFRVHKYDLQMAKVKLPAADLSIGRAQSLMETHMAAAAVAVDEALAREAREEG